MTCGHELSQEEVERVSGVMNGGYGIRQMSIRWGKEKIRRPGEVLESISWRTVYLSQEIHRSHDLEAE